LIEKIIKKSINRWAIFIGLYLHKIEGGSQLPPDAFIFKLFAQKKLHLNFYTQKIFTFYQIANKKNHFNLKINFNKIKSHSSKNIQP
jgi:hypothetical protein